MAPYRVHALLMSRLILLIYYLLGFRFDWFYQKTDETILSGVDKINIATKRPMKNI